MASADKTPRALEMRFVIQVGPKVAANIHSTRIRQAFLAIQNAVMALIPTVLPQAGSVYVERRWLYNWTDESETLDLPPTESNGGK